jgi:hypothetical protein
MTETETRKDLSFFKPPTSLAAASRRAGDPQRSGLERALIRAHEGNIRRYARILRTKLTPIERQFVMRRMSEERLALRRLKPAGALADGSAPATSPHTFTRERNSAMTVHADQSGPKASAVAFNRPAPEPRAAMSGS